MTSIGGVPDDTLPAGLVCEIAQPDGAVRLELWPLVMSGILAWTLLSREIPTSNSLEETSGLTEAAVV